MADLKVKRLPNGEWECRIDGEEDVVLRADTQEEAERMAEAYQKGNEQVKKRIARGSAEKARTRLVN